MNIKREFNRIGHLFNDGVEKTQHETRQRLDQGVRRANEAARRLRTQVDTGTRSMVTIEEAIVRHMRENPALYIMGAALLIGALVVRVVLEARRMPPAPLL